MTARLRLVPARGALYSALLHGLVLLLLLLPSADEPPADEPPADVTVAVELVGPGPLEAPAPPAGRPAPPAAAIAPTVNHPAPSPPPPPPAPAPAPRRTVKPPLPAPAADAFSLMLRDVWQMRSQTGPVAGDGAKKAGPPGGHGGKDVIRAQIERHWEFDIGRFGDADLPIALHLVLAGDGRVMKAEIVDDPRTGPKSGNRPLALSLRNAALAASPLQMPAWAGGPQDLVLGFNPRQVSR